MTSELFELFNSVRIEVNNNDHLQHLGRFCNTELLLQSGEQSVQIAIEHGGIVNLFDGPLNMRAWQFALRAQPQTWNEFWKPIPAVGYNDIFALSRHGYLTIEGDVGHLLGNLRYLKDVLATPRQILAGLNTDPGAAA